MNVLALYGNPLMDAGLRTYIMKIHFVSSGLKKNPSAISNSISSDDGIEFDLLVN